MIGRVRLKEDVVWMAVSWRRLKYAVWWRRLVRWIGRISLLLMLIVLPCQLLVLVREGFWMAMSELGMRYVVWQRYWTVSAFVTSAFVAIAV